MDLVYLRIPEGERESLPSAIGEYVHAIVAFAVRRLSEFGEAIAEMVGGVYVQSPGGERFVQDPTRLDSITQTVLYLDQDGHLVTVKNPVIERRGYVRGEAFGVLVMESYQSYEVLTGTLAGQRFDKHSRPLPAEPIYRPGVVMGAAAAAMPLTGGRDAEPLSTSGERLRVFLCHSSVDKEAVRVLHGKLQQSGFQPWLDEIDLLGGQDWELEITKAVRNAHVVLVCLSRQAEKRGFMQKEIKRALDVADEQPEGTTFLIPVRLEDCPVPERLKRWQWVDLYRENGYTRLEVALRACQGRVSV